MTRVSIGQHHRRKIKFQNISTDNKGVTQGENKARKSNGWVAFEVNYESKQFVFLRLIMEVDEWKTEKSPRVFNWIEKCAASASFFIFHFSFFFFWLTLSILETIFYVPLAEIFVATGDFVATARDVRQLVVHAISLFQ